MMRKLVGEYHLPSVVLSHMKMTTILTEKGEGAVEEAEVGPHAGEQMMMTMSLGI